MKLVSDVGGTNVRFALAEGTEVQPDTIQSFRNDDFSTFYDAARAYTEGRDCSGITSMAVAVAGPVNGDTARLTNRDWDFDTLRLEQIFGVPTALLNDLKALGYSLTALDASGVLSITPDLQPSGDQRLVAGIGTGFNVSPAIQTPAGITVPNAEMGHIQLSWRLHRAVSEHVGHADHGIETVEHLFSGRGCEKLWKMGSGSHVSVADAMALQDAQAIEFAGFYAGLMAGLAQDLSLAFMCTGGLYFAGGVARAILTGPGAAGFRSAYAEPLALPTARHVPVSLILDDTAALSGCAVAM